MKKLPIGIISAAVIAMSGGVNAGVQGTGAPGAVIAQQGFVIAQATTTKTREDEGDKRHKQGNVPPTTTLKGEPKQFKQKEDEGDKRHMQGNVPPTKTLKGEPKQYKTREDQR